MRIGVYTIVKDEAQNLAGWAASARDADLLAVTDTGSSDGTVALAQSLGIRVNHATFDPFHFGDARNAAIDFLPDDLDACISLDADQTLAPGWRAELEREWRPEILLAPTVLEDGTAYRVPRIHRRHGPRWVGRIHEVLADPTGSGSQPSQVQLLHRPHRSKDRGFYLDLLEQALQEDPSSRNKFYYARELHYLGRNAESIAAFTDYLVDPGSNFAHERAHACVLLATMDPGPAWLFRSLAELPAQRCAHWQLALHYYAEQQWHLCYAMAHCALGLPANEYFVEAPVAESAIHDMIALAAYHIGHAADAISHGSRACELAPADSRLAENLKWYRGLGQAPTSC